MRSEKLTTNVVIAERFERGILNLAGDLLQRGYKTCHVLMCERNKIRVIYGRRVSLYKGGESVKRDNRACEFVFEMISHNSFLMCDIECRHTMLIMNAMIFAITLGAVLEFAHV